MKNVNALFAFLYFFMTKFSFHLVFLVLMYYNAGIRLQKSSGGYDYDDTEA